MTRHSYFHRLRSLWNAMPIMDINLYITLKRKLKSFLWNHFLTNFDESNKCTFHFLCPCSICHQSRPPITNFKHLQLTYYFKHCSVSYRLLASQHANLRDSRSEQDSSKLFIPSDRQFHSLVAQKIPAL